MNCRRAMRGMSTASSDAQLRFMAQDKCILVDDLDNIIGSASKYECHTAESASLHRAFSVFLFDESDRILLQKRASSKITFPDVWTNTCCSHPLATGIEKYGVSGVCFAATRKLYQELGLVVPVDTFRFVSRIVYKAHQECGQWVEHERM